MTRTIQQLLDLQGKTALVTGGSRGLGLQMAHALGEAGEVTEKFTLRPGDCLYLPRGLMHDAENVGEEPSLHITVGLITKTWADLLLEAISELALSEPGFRRSLPPGFAGRDFDREEWEPETFALFDRFITPDNPDLLAIFNEEQLVKVRPLMKAHMEKCEHMKGEKKGEHKQH